MTDDQIRSILVAIARLETKVDGLVGEVARVERAAAAGIERNDKRWGQLVGTVCLIVLAAVVGLVVGSGGKVGL